MELKIKLKFPVNCNTEASRLSFAYKADEVLRLEHNIMGAKFRNEEITKSEWNTYLSNVFEPKSKAIQDALNAQKDNARKGTYWSVDLETDFEDI